MDFRITPQVIVSRGIAYAQRNTAELANLQDQASSGKRLLRPSDDPIATVAVLANRAQSLRLDSYLSNIREARGGLDVSVSALQETSDILSQARQIAIEGSHATIDAAAAQSLATEVDALLGRLINVSNTQNTGRYIFAGTAVQTAPFSVTARDNEGYVQSVTYGGSSERAQVTVSLNQTVGTFYTGSEVFQKRDRGATVFTGATGAAPGTGTDSATGQGTLLVSHTLTTYAAGSGVQAGVSSVAGDTILGPAGAHTLTVNDTSGTGASGTISLDGGPAVAFSNSDTDLKVNGAAGQLVYVDTTAITAGFSGNLSITADGALSVDNGATSTAIDFSSNQTVTFGTSGAVTNVDSSNIRVTGSEHIDYGGSYDAFQLLIALRDDLRNTRGLTDAERSEQLSARLGEFDRVRNNVLQVLGQQSATLQSLESLEKRVQDIQLETTKQTSDLESADISQVVLSLQEHQNLLQLTLASTARLMSESLLDFLK
jgi:flagellar hook-associated protein 3 FlgL